MVKLTSFLGGNGFHATFFFLSRFTIIAWTHTKCKHTSSSLPSHFHCSLHPMSTGTIKAQDKLFSKLAPISATAEMDKNQFTHVIKCYYAHPIICWLVQATGSFLKSMNLLSACKMVSYAC